MKRCLKCGSKQLKWKDQGSGWHTQECKQCDFFLAWPPEGQARIHNNRILLIPEGHLCCGKKENRNDKKNADSARILCVV